MKQIECPGCHQQISIDEATINSGNMFGCPKCKAELKKATNAKPDDEQIELLKMGSTT